MAKQLYGYSPSYGGPGATNLSAVYASKPIPSVADSYLSSSAPSSAYSSAAAAAERVSSFLLNKTASDAGYASWASGADDPGVPGLKRPSEALYHQTVMGAYNTIEQSEAWFSSNTLAKRTRLESAGNFPIYPQRPGEKDCAHYMQTRTCKFGDMCKYDHPIWVPEGGIPDWKEVPLAATSEYLPERPGELDCPYFLKTQKCKFGLKCKFNHPKDVLVSSATFGDVDATSLPERPSEPPCSFYMKTGKCKYGGTCKFHHPKDILASSTGLDNDSGSQSASLMVETMNTMLPANPALMHNSKGLPVRPGEVDCPFYMKTGSCKYGATCRFNHPDRYAINPPAATFGHAFLASPATLNVGVVNPSTSILQATDPRLTQTMLGLEPTAYPQRPGQIECDFYMKTGACKFGERCRFHHPIDRSAPTLSMVKQAVEQNVKLTLAGLPRRENSVICPYYLKTATCKFGATCKFDHPPPGEVMKISAPQGTSMSPKEEPGKGVQA